MALLKRDCLWLETCPKLRTRAFGAPYVINGLTPGVEFTMAVQQVLTLVQISFCRSCLFVAPLSYIMNIEYNIKG